MGRADSRSAWRAPARLCAVAALAACGPLPPETPRAGEPGASSARIVTTERGGRGGRLVVVGEGGARLAELTELGAEPAIDSTPAFSGDGRFVAFASTRGRRRLDETSLWLADARGGSEPRRLTRGAAIDRDPVWGPASSWLVFSSSRAGSFDLYRVPVRRGDDGWPELAGEPVALTSAPTQELSPSLSPDGRELVYMAIDERGFSTLWTIPVAGGRPRQLTEGPIDVTPAWGPGGDIAFAAAADGGDADLFVLDPDSGERRRVIRGELGDETGPRWSADGRYLFATAVFRSAVDQRAILSSLVVVDLREQPAVLRALCDPAAVESRLGVALAPVPLDAEALRQNERYEDALRRAMRQEEARRRAAGEPGF